MDELSIILVSYNVKDYLEKCIASIRLHCSDAEIIVVDNNSSDGSITLLNEKFPGLRIVANKTNRGFSGANNQGLALASFQNILLLNPDTEIINDGLKKGIRMLHEQKQCIIGPGLLNTDGSVQTSCLKYPDLLTLFLETFYLHTIFRYHEYSLSNTPTPVAVEAISGAAMLFRKKMVQQIGGLDESLFWMEDVDFCFRARQAGAEVFYLSFPVIIHHGGKSSKSNLSAAIANQLMSKLKFMDKHHGKAVFGIASLLILLHIVSRVALLSVAALFDQDARKKYEAYEFSFKKFYAYMVEGKNEIC